MLLYWVNRKAHTTSTQAKLAESSQGDLHTGEHTGALYRELVIRAGADKDKTDQGTMIGDWSKG